NVGACGKEKLTLYPEAMILKLSRPFTFDFVPVQEEVARILTTRYIKEFKNLKKQSQTQEALNNIKQGLLVIKVKIFAYEPGEDVKTDVGFNAASVLAILEGYDVYADTKRKDLLYSQSFLRKKRTSEFEQKLKEQYQKLQKKKE
ncbi:MAG: hypothetical protein ACPGRX_01575, partial [Bdellovibrionales bacterium]